MNNSTRNSHDSQSPKRTYLTDGDAIPISPAIAVQHGINAAAFLQQLHFLLTSVKTSQREYNFTAGRYWIYYSYEQWAEHIPWLSVGTIKRVVQALVKTRVLLIHRNPHNNLDRTNWYTIDYSRLNETLGTANSDTKSADASSQIAPMDKIKTRQSKSAKRADVSTITNTNNDKRVAPAKADAAPLPELTPEQLFDLAANGYQSRPVSNDVAKALVMPTNSKPDKPARAFPHFDAIVEAFGVDSDRLTKTEKGGIGKVANELKAAGYTPEDILAIHAYCVRQKFESFTWHALTAHASKWRATQISGGRSEDAPRATGMFAGTNYDDTYWERLSAAKASAK